MSLANASEARKARLIALRKRKAGEAVDDGYVGIYNELYAKLTTWSVYSEAAEPVIKHRIYDPETKTLKRRTDEDVEMDTVENHIEGLAEQIIEEDAQQRAQDLVSSMLGLGIFTILIFSRRIYIV